MTRTDGALAQQAQPAVAVPAGPVAIEGGRPSGRRQPVQGSLFWDKPAGKIIPFDSFPSPPSGNARPRAKTSAGSRSGGRSRRTYSHEGQGELDFLPPAPAKPRTLGTTVEAVIFCEDPVASRVHRAVAAACDWSLVLLAYGMFLSVYRLCGGEFLLDRSSLLMIGSVLPLLACLYGLMWAVAGYETPGMRWTNLRLTTFDGFRPEKDQRMLRFLGSCLSLCTVVGLLWSFADEESLAWPDHISKTFPTPRRIDSQTFHRR
ncbi:MAG TPA: RDD family protein [Bryobacteraceae bacterium]|nr:RDD family protein [Bryobacteraceae bacterium]